MSKIGELETVNIEENDESIVRELEKNIDSVHLSNDEAIARELQEQFDWEYNENLKKLEKLQNVTSKLNISYKKYDINKDFEECNEEDFDEFDPQDNINWERFETVDKTFNSIPSCGYLFNKDGFIVTKHDINLNGQRNMKKLMTLPPDVQTGDGITHVGISNNVLNGLKSHCQNETHHKNARRKEQRQPRKRKSVLLKNLDLYGLDQSTSSATYSFFRGNNPCLKKINGIIWYGHKSVIYSGENNIPIPSHCVIKLYRKNTYHFIEVEKHIINDFRYEDRYNCTISRFNKISIWVEKERDNLLRLQKYILCPKFIALKNNVLVMSFIGEKEIPAPKLADLKLTSDEYQSAYNQIVATMRIMYRKARLVHTDLNACNVLWHRSKCYFVDVSRAVDVADKDAFGYLKKDCVNITEFFKRKLSGIMTKQELFKYVCNQDYDKKKRLEQIIAELQKNRCSKNKLLCSDNKFQKVCAKPKGIKLVGV